MGQMKVLYVDDEPDIREVATFSLELDPEMEVRNADGGPAALDIIDADEWRPDVVLLDVMMPDMDGPSVLAEIRRRQPDRQLPVIFVTARAQPQELAAFRSQGAVGVITKPFQPMELAAEVRRLLGAAA